MSQITSTATAMRRAAATPVTRERKRTARMNVSKEAFPEAAKGDRPAGRAAARRVLEPPLFDRQGLVDQLLPVRDVLRELGVAALLRDVEPGVVGRVVQRDHLVLVVLEGLEGLLVHGVRLALVVGLGLLPGREDHVLLLLRELREVLLGHEERLVHEPERVRARRGEAVRHLVEARR